MAGDWIKIETVTPDKPEIFAMADYLKIDPDAVVGKLLRFWIWADQQTSDGHAVSVTKSLLDRIAGEPHFGDAMESVGWLESTDTGIAIPNFDRHNGETAKQRALAAKRQAKKRAKSHANSHADVTLGALPREEKSRVTTPLNPPRGGTSKKRKWTEADQSFDRVREVAKSYGRENSIEEIQELKSVLTPKERGILEKMKAQRFRDIATSELNVLKGEFRQQWENWEDSS